MKDVFDRPRFALLAAMGVVATLVMAGCSQREQETPSTTVVTTTPGATTTTTTAPPGSATTTPATNNTNAGPGGPTGTEDAVAQEIMKTITTNTQMTGSRVTAVVDASGVATLTGFTQNQQQKALAERAARETSGVISVKNKLEIRPTGGVKPPKAPAPKTEVIVVPGPPERSSETTATPETGGDGSSGTTAEPGTMTTPSEPTTTTPPTATPPATGGGQ